MSASTRGEPQPQALALLSPYSRQASATESSAAPSQSTFASGARLLARDVALDRERRRQRHQPEPEQPRRVQRLDDQARDHEPDAAADAERGADPADRGRTRSGGNVSRMIPNASGKIPPPTPWITRPRDEHAERRRERAHHAAGGERPAAPWSARGRGRRGRRACRRSASRPTPRAGSRSGSTRPTPASAPNSRWISGRAGETTVCESANAIPASSRDRKTTRV